MPSKALLVTRPEHDIITKYFCFWSDEVLAVAKDKHIPIYDLRGTKAAHSQVESYLRNRKPGIVFLNGHGNESEIAGHDNETILNQDTVAPDAIIYARSCDAAQLLGDILVRNGARTFIGYKRKFILGYSPDKIMHPAQDFIASLFLRPSNLIVTALLKNNTAQEAHRRSKAAMYKNFRRMISSAASFEERYAAKWLWSNINCQVVIGDAAGSLG